MKKVSKKIFIISIALILMALIIYFLFIRFNFHTVIKGQVYRSAQPSKQQLADLMKKYKIRSVINLRSLRVGDSRYQAEDRACRSLGLKLIHLPMSPKRFPSLIQLKQLVNVLQTTPKPVLIHCMAGADRTGLASATVLILHNYPIQVAEQQYSVFHLALSFNSVGKLVIPYYVRWLRQHNFSSNRKNFLLWMSELKPGTNFPLPQDDPNKYRIKEALYA